MDFIYDNAGRPFALKYSNDGGGTFTTYYYILNFQGDVVALLNTSGTVVARYTYNAWGEILSVTTDNGTAITGSLHIAHINPLRYRGYYYDAETEFYYLQSRYYDPLNHRFINADSIVSTGQGFTGTNMFAYCLNNPVILIDCAGTVPSCFVTVAEKDGGPADYSSPRSDLANAPDLDVSTASPGSYNCYGNGIGKQIDTSPTGYNPGDSTRETFESVKNDLGSNNVRELTSINDPIGDDEFKVAIKCGPFDYHFIRLDGDEWYNKSGTMPGLYIDQAIVEGEVWFAIWMDNGTAYWGLPYYNDETIYFAVKVGWDAQ